MIDLITGLPGNAKTLFTIAMVKKWAESENRPVFYSGIPELKLDWQEIDPTKWMDCPPRSIVLIDECQRIFRNRSLGAVPPKHVSDLETHRHLGIDLVFITQHPSLVDPAIRKLTQKHRHLVRIFGMEASTIHQWDSVRDNCDKPTARKDSEKTRWAFDKSVFKLYKSADEHTFKRSFPMRLKLLLLVPILLIAAVFAVKGIVFKDRVSDVPKVVGQGAQVPVTGGQVRGDVRQAFDPVADAKQFVAMATPRIAGLPHTAPKYDQLTVPTHVPVPAACLQIGSVSDASDKPIRCKCYSQQGTIMPVELNMCIEFARNGFFQEFDADRDREDSSRTREGLRVMASREGVRSSESGPSLISIPNIPDSLPRSRAANGSGKSG